jgi:hypothetical protein
MAASFSGDKLAAADPSQSKPWEFIATGQSLTLSWLAFAIIIVIVCAAGTAAGCAIQKRRGGDGQNAYLSVNPDAHDLY